ncbi:hypothetical protein E2C01_032935 [Portunus trituberculatus]|uniref:Uncharacterized protein n=1 Tax=Portunus trituberculatus TaxID=210409 RepID=A0A5B7EWI2_PORTR|nr:hypothetical protein [Portunus trituberculatus]
MPAAGFVGEWRALRGAASRPALPSMSLRVMWSLTLQFSFRDRSVQPRPLPVLFMLGFCPFRPTRAVPSRLVLSPAVPSRGGTAPTGLLSLGTPSSFVWATAGCVVPDDARGHRAS